MTNPSKGLVRAYWGATLALLAAAALMAWLYAPVEETMGPVQKIFYLHLPAAINMFLAALAVFVASIGYIWTRHSAWDRLGAAAAKVTVLYCSVVLLTGVIWGHSAWGQWWTWSPRLTFSLVLWLLYVAYLMIRPSIDSAQRRALTCAVYGAVAFLDVPLVYLSVKLLRDIHPSSVSLAPPMQHTLWLSFVPITMLCAGLIWMLFAAERKRPTLDGASPLSPPPGAHLAR